MGIFNHCLKENNQSALGDKFLLSLQAYSSLAVVLQTQALS